VTRDRGWGRDNDRPSRLNRLLVGWSERLARDAPLEERLRSLQKTLRTDTRYFGSGGRPTTLCRIKIADTLDALGRSDEAIAARVEAVAACRSHVGPQDQQTLYARLGLARTLQMSGRLRDAQAEAAAVFEVGRRTCGTEHDLTKKAAAMMGRPSLAEMTYGEANLVTGFSGTRARGVEVGPSRTTSTRTAEFKKSPKRRPEDDS